MPAAPIHHTATSDAAWDGGAAEKNLGTDYTTADLQHVFAWLPDGNDPNKADCVMPHHFVDADGTPGDASTVACSAAIGSLNGARGGTTIPEGDRRGAYNHLIAHLKDAGTKEADLPELKAAPRHPHRELRTTTPLQLLREHRGGMRGQRERRARRAEFEFRAKPDGTGGTSYSFEGYAATFEQPFEMWDMWGDPYFEVLGAGACNRTLANGADVQFLIGHDESGIPLARTKSGTMTLSADSRGLAVAVPSLDGRSPIVQSLASAMERGDMDEMSIGFVCTQQQWSPDWMERRINEINLNRGDVSVVCWAANPNANGASMAAVPVSEAAARQAGLGREQRTPTAPYSAKPGEGNECPQCHSMNDLDAAYCDQCGTAVRSTGAAAADENETQRCPCGSWNADDAKFCDQCGTNLASDQDADNGGRGNGATEAPTGYWDGWRRPERRSGDPGTTPDFSTKPPQNVAAHGDASLVCPNTDCQAPNATDAAYCDQCGQCLYDEGGLIATGSLDDVVTDTSGLIEEEDMTLARQRRTRILQLRAR